MIYGREALRRLREQQATGLRQIETGAEALANVPLEAPYDDPDAVLHVWNGERWVTWQSWLATAPIIRGEKPVSTLAPEMTCVAGECGGGAKVWLVRDGERWLMFVGCRKPGGRRRDFASPFLEHALRTAEHWYGAPLRGWRTEKGRNDRAAEAADLPPQDSTDEEKIGNRELDDVDLGWR